MIKFFKQLFCKHYYQVTKDNDSYTARILNDMGYYSKESTCILCNKKVGHD